MGIRFSHILGSFLISTSPKIFQKLIILQCLCFHMLFPHYGNSVFPCVGKSTHFCFTLSILGSPSLGVFLCLSHIFSVIWEFTSSILRRLPVFYPDNFKKPIIWKYFEFSRAFSVTTFRLLSGYMPNVVCPYLPM